MRSSRRCVIHVEGNVSGKVLSQKESVAGKDYAKQRAVEEGPGPGQ